MSAVPTNPFYEVVKNWNANLTQMISGFRTRAETLRSNWYSRLYGPTPTGVIRPLRRMRLAAMQPAGRRVPATGRVIPHASQPGYEKYDFTYSKGASKTAPFTTSKRLGMEGEPYDFSY